MSYLLNWKPSPSDARDKTKLIALSSKLFPTKLEMAEKIPVSDQGKYGSCTANAIATAVMTVLDIEYDEYFIPSRFFIYYYERLLGGFPAEEDSGAYIRDGFKVINKRGVCNERRWDYLPENFAVEPSPEAQKEARLHLALVYKAVPNTILDIKDCLSAGRPVVFGCNVYSSFMSKRVAKTGVMPMPKPSEQCQGGHAMCIIGYDDKRKAFLVRNSWGYSWGKKGNIYIPYAFMESKECDDFWCLELIK
jgi:C1A family cysteine protease